MVKLTQAGGKFAAAGAGAGNNDNRFASRNIFISAVPFIADDQVNIGGVAFGEFVGVDLDAPPFKFVFKGFGGRLVGITGDNYCFNVDAPFIKIIYGFQGVGIISNAKVGADFFPLNIAGIDTKNNIDFIF